MKRMNEYVNETERTIKGIVSNTEEAYRAADCGYSDYTLNTLQTYGYRAKTKSEDAYYSIDKARNGFSNIERAYKEEVAQLTKEINDLIDELNNEIDKTSDKNLEIKEQVLIAKIREIDMKAGTAWYKEEGSKLVKPLREKLRTMKRVSKEKVEKEENNLEEVSVFSSAEYDLTRSRTYAYEAKDQAYKATYSDEPKDAKYFLGKCYDEAIYAHRFAESALPSFRNDVDTLTTNLNTLEAKKAEVKKQLSNVKNNNSRLDNLYRISKEKVELVDYKRELTNLQDKLAKIYEQAGTPWYKEVGSKQARELRKEISTLQKTR